jgi:glycosyltransferase involved in cell wall biosynthesis
MLAVLMSTYNGSKYVKEQIESILNQTYQDLELFIRDDGSSDETYSIIHKYAELYPNKVHLCEDNLKNIGFIRSFLQLIKCVEADYYAFSDQDDIFFPEKYSSVIEVLDKYNNPQSNKPLGIICNGEVTDENLSSIGVKMYDESFGLDFQKCVNDFIYGKNHLFSPLGCSITFNHAVKNFIFKDNKLLLSNTTLDTFFHDALVWFICTINGKFLFLNKNLQFYRQHKQNTHGFHPQTKLRKKEYVINIIKKYKMVYNRNFGCYRNVGFKVPVLKLLFNKIKYIFN